LMKPLSPHFGRSCILLHSSVPRFVARRIKLDGHREFGAGPNGYSTALKYAMYPSAVS